MAQVDTSSYPQPQQGQNPLQSLQSLVGIQGQAISNQQNVLQMRAQQAIGRATQGATNPDGSFSPNRFMGLVRGDPNAAFEAQKAQEFAQAQQVSQLELGLKHNAMFIGGLQGVLAQAQGPDGKINPDKLTPQAVMERASALVNEGVLDAKTVASESKTMPSDGPGIQGWINAHIAQAMSQQQAMEATYGQLTSVNNGQQTNFYRPTGFGTGNPPQTQMQITPEQAATPVQGPVNPDGSPTTEPFAQRATQGKITTGQGPAQTASQSVTGTANAQQAAQLSQQANEAQTVLKPLYKNMSGALNNFTSGNGATAWGKFKGALNFWGITPSNDQGLSEQQQFHKYASMLAQRQASMLSGGTNMGLATATAGSPNEDYTNMTNHQLLATLQGQADALVYANKKWQGVYGKSQDASRYGEFMQFHNQQLGDQRAFSFQYLNPTERKAMLDNMPPQQRSQFLQNYHALQNKGVVKEGGQ